MRKKLRLLFFVTVSVFLVASCSKYDKMLDFDWGNMEIDGNMNWGIPLINAEYSIGRILNAFGDMGFIRYDSNGDYYFDFTVLESECLSAANLNRLQNTVRTLSLACPLSETTHIFDPNYIDISTEDMLVNTAILKSGQFKFDFSKVTPSDINSINYDILIESNTIFNVADNSRFSMKLSKNNPIGYAPCSELKIITDNSKLNFTITITLHYTGAPSVDALLLTPLISLLDITFKDADIEILKEQRQRSIENSVFSVFSHNLSLDAVLHDPKLLLHVTNTFGCDAEIVFTDIFLEAQIQKETILLQGMPPIPIPKNFTGPIDISSYIKKEIPLTLNYDALKYEYFTILPKGTTGSVYDISAVEVGMNFSVPLDITINEAVFHDTLMFNMPGLSDLSFFDTVKIRTAFMSSIPSAFNVQLWLYNFRTRTIIDTLLSEPVKIEGSYDGKLVSSKTQYISVTNNKLQAMQQANRIILRISLNTNERHLPFNRDHNLYARVGANIKKANDP